MNHILFEKIRDALPENNFIVSLLYYDYDVPVKTKDKLKIDDASAEVFSFIICYISPISTTKGSLGYLPDKDFVGENPQLLVADKPVYGFMYPAFDERSSDSGHAMVFDPDGNIQLFMGAVEEIKAPEPKATEKKKDKKDSAKADKADKASEPESADAIPSLDTGSLNTVSSDRPSTSTVEHIAQDDTRGLEKEYRVMMSEIPEKTSQSKGHYKDKVRIFGNTKKVKKQMSDGVNCYVVPVSEALMEEKE